MRVQKTKRGKTASRSRHSQTVLSVTTMIGVFIIVLLAGGCPNPPGDTGPAADWYVPADFATIQEAIDEASAGEIILVASGTYVENITLKDGVTLLGEDHDTTIIDAGGSGSAVYSTNCGSDTVIEGFTITGGLVPAGGMYNNSSVTVRNCTFTANQGDAGSGMRNSGGSPTIENCEFNGNTGVGTGENYGAGMYNVNSSPTISGCIFENNVAVKGSDPLNPSGRAEVRKKKSVQRFRTKTWGRSSLFDKPGRSLRLLPVHASGICTFSLKYSL